jgi:hypothetical protein
MSATTHAPTTASTAPPRIPPARTAPWRETAGARIVAARGLAHAFADCAPPPGEPRDALLEVVEVHLDAAQHAVSGTDQRWAKRNWAALRGASVDRAAAHLDDAEVGLLRVAPDMYVKGKLPALFARIRTHLRAGDPQLVELERLVGKYGKDPEHPLSQVDREAIASICDAGCGEARREVARVRSYRNVLVMTALALWIAVGALTAVTAARPSLLPLCFTPVQTAVCPTHTGPKGGAAAVVPARPVPGAAGGDVTNAQEAQQAEVSDAVMRRTASPWDVPLVELVGLVAAAVAAAVALRSMRATSTPFSLPTALAFLKVPTGALTAVLGIVLLRGQFIPGLSALDTSGQILAWAAVFGAAQQLVTRLIDRQANELIEKVGTPGTTKAPDGTTEASPAA